jgi:hypothetical protein
MVLYYGFGGNVKGSKNGIHAIFRPWGFYEVKTPAKAVETAASLPPSMPFDKRGKDIYG